MESFLSIYADGGARGNPGQAACGIVFTKEGKQFFKASKYLGEATNNIAEYKGVIFALEILLKNPQWIVGDRINFFLDSELIVNQLIGKYKIKNTILADLSFSVKELERKIPATISYQHIVRSKNSVADFLVNEELDKHQ